MNIKIFPNEDDVKRRDQIEKNLIIMGTGLISGSWVYRFLEEAFCNLELEKIRPYWNDLNKDIIISIICKGHLDEFRKMMNGKYVILPDQTFKGSELYNDIIRVSIEQLFRTDYYGDRPEKYITMCEEIVIFHPEILEESFLKLPMLERVLAFKTLIDKNFAKLHSPYWINFCQNIIDNIDWTTLGGLSGEMLLLAADVLDEIKKDVDWEIIYACFAKLVEHNRRTCDNFGKMINMCLQKIPDIIFEYAMEANFKKVHKDIRMEVYSAIIGAGLFDVQLARRIRSDSSMYVSSICIESFFKEKMKSHVRLVNFERPDGQTITKRRFLYSNQKHF